MKNILRPLLRALPLALILALLCCSCFTTYDTSAEVDGYTVDFQTGQMTDGESVYEFKWSGDEDDGSATVILPGGYRYSESWGSSGLGVAGYGNSTMAEHELAEKLTRVVRDALTARKNPPILPPLPFIVAGFGALQIAYPKIYWYLTIGWIFKDTEPSNAYLTIGRIIGGLIVFAGVVLFFLQIGGQ